MITAIPNQPIDFTSLPIEGCCTDEQPMSHIGDTDFATFQVLAKGCEGTTYVHTGVGAGITLNGFGWATTIDGCLRYNDGDSDASMVVNDWTPTIGDTYHITLYITELYGTAVLTVGGNTVSITKVGTIEITITATTTDPLTITVTDDKVELTLCDLTVEEQTHLYTLFVNETTYAYGDYPAYFGIDQDNGTVTVNFPMSQSGLNVGECVTFGLRDDCDNTLLTSQPFEVVDADDCHYLPVRGCNDGNAMGFFGSFVPRTRVPAMLGWPKWEYEVTRERDENGNIRLVYGDRRMKWTLRVGEVNYSDHAFLSLAPLFHHFYIGDREVAVDADDYEPIYGDVRTHMGGVDRTVRPKVELVRNVLCEAEGEGCSPLTDPQCPEPHVNIVLEDDFDLTVEIVSMGGFEVDTITGTQDGVSSGVSYAGQPLPVKLKVGTFYGTGPITLHFTDGSGMGCTYDTTVYPPPFTCSEPTSISLIVPAGETIDWFYVDNTSDHSGGYFMIEGDATVYDVNGTTLSGGRYCIYTTDAGGSVDGVPRSIFIDASALSQFDGDVLAGMHVINLFADSLTTLDVSSWTAAIAIGLQANGLTTLDVSAWTAAAYIELYADSLTTLDVSAWTAATFIYITVNGLTTLDVSAWTVATQISLQADDITTLDMSAWTAAYIITLRGSSISSVTAPASFADNSGDFSISASFTVLDQTSVDAILAAAVANASIVTGSIQLSGGCAAPSASGYTDKSTLQGRGLTVFTN